MSESIAIPLNQLISWKGNVRTTGAAEGLGELAASLATHGQLQSLLVRRAKRGKYEVLAGCRRLAAFQFLARQGKIAADHLVNCALATDTVDPAEVSLAENIVRLPMHPLDQFAAFRTIIDAGATVADVAARFGVTELLIRRRLKLARLSPNVLEAYRCGDITLEMAQAFALTDDHAAQDRVLADLSGWSRDAASIRHALTQDEAPTTDKRVRFLGLEPYEAAGGQVRYDLFSDQGEGYVMDVGLLDTLAAEKLQQAATAVTTEGWRWVRTSIDLDYGDLYRLQRLQPARVELPSKQQDELDRLTRQLDDLTNDDTAEHDDTIAELEARIDTLASRCEYWSDDQLQRAGAIVTLAHDGQLRIERGLVDPDNMAGSLIEDVEQDAHSTAGATSKGHSAKLITELTAERSAAIAAELLGRLDLALAATVHCLTLPLLPSSQSSDSCLQLLSRPAAVAQHMVSPGASSALARLTDAFEQLSRLPSDPGDLWQWCLAASREQLLGQLAVIAATTVNAVRGSHDDPACARLDHADRLADAIGLDMTRWFTPTAENYFQRISRSAILAAVDEAKGGHGPGLEKLKKSELAARAEAMISGTGWLPQPLRTREQDA